MTWGGFLSWQSSTRDADGYDQLKERIEAYEAMNYSIRRLEPPDFAAFPGNFDLAAYTTFSGHVDAALATNVFLEGARARGALVVYPCEVNEIVLEQGRLRHVATSCGRFPLDRLVIAAGVGTPSLAALVGLNVPLVHSPGILAQSLPMEAMLRAVAYPPGVHIKQTRDGRLVAADVREPPAHVAAHEDILRGKIRFPDHNVYRMHGERILGKIAEFLPSAAPTRLDKVMIGFRPVPEDGYPIIGPAPRAPDIHVAVT